VHRRHRAVIYEMTTGIKAFGAADVQSILRNVVEVTPRPASDINADIPAPLSDLLSKMMSKNPEDRVASASIAADEIREIRKQFVTATDGVVEELSAPVDEEGVSTLAARAPSLESGSQPSSTAVTGGKDLTPSFGRLARHPVLRRRISPAVFISAVVLLLASLSGAAYSIRSRTNSAPTFTYSPAQLREFEQKREALAAARVLFMAGEYEQSVNAYDAFLDRYPNTPSAVEGRDEASKALELSKAKTKVTVTAKKPSATKKPAVADAPPPEPEKKKGFWRRVFGRP
jgi:serine/threonine protein kinase